MSAIGMVLIWIWAAVVFAIWSRWSTGKEIDRRQAYWDKYEVR